MNWADASHFATEPGLQGTDLVPKVLGLAMDCGLTPICGAPRNAWVNDLNNQDLESTLILATQ